MEIEEIYNDLYLFWKSLPEPKKSYSVWFYGEVKPAIEKWQKDTKPGFDLQVARILKEHLDIAGFDSDRVPDEVRMIEEFCHRTFMQHDEEEEIDVSWNQ